MDISVSPGALAVPAINGVIRAPFPVRVEGLASSPTKTTLLRRVDPAHARTISVCGLAGRDPGDADSEPSGFRITRGLGKLAQLEGLGVNKCDHYTG